MPTCEWCDKPATILTTTIPDSAEYADEAIPECDEHARAVPPGHYDDPMPHTVAQTPITPLGGMLTDN